MQLTSLIPSSAMSCCYLYGILKYVFLYAVLVYLYFNSILLLCRCSRERSSLFESTEGFEDVELKIAQV